MSLRAFSTAAALAEPSAGTWLRRAIGAVGAMGAVVAVGAAGPPFADGSGLGAPAVAEPLSVSVVIDLALSLSDKQKTLASPGEGPIGLRGSWRLALVPPRSSVLSPGAGNELKQPIKARKRAKKREERYVDEPVRLDRHMDTSTVRRGDDGDPAAILSIETAQAGLHVALYRPAHAERSAQSSRDHTGVNVALKVRVAPGRRPPAAGRGRVGAP
ncbi:MAG: hypothetical protein ABIQ58_08495 [Candidatus Limnocylindrales bacterium]